MIESRSGVTIRQAAPADTDVIVRMAQKFLECSSYRDQLSMDPGFLEHVIHWVRDEQLLLVAVDEDRSGQVVGMLGMAIIAAPLSGEAVANEVVWWMDEDYRGRTYALRMWRAAEAWAREKGAAAIQMIAPAGNRGVGQLYERSGYVELETVYQRRIDY